MNKVSEMITKYQKELEEIVGKMESTKNEITRLNNVGIELTAMANVVAGKIEALKELGEEELQNVNDTKI